MQAPGETANTRSNYSYDSQLRTSGISQSAAQVSYTYSGELVESISTASGTEYLFDYGTFDTLSSVKIGQRTLVNHTYSKDANHWLARSDYGNGDYVTILLGGWLVPVMRTMRMPSRMLTITTGIWAYGWITFPEEARSISMIFRIVLCDMKRQGMIFELDAERGHHGSRTTRRGALLVHPAGRCTEPIQVGASANDRGFRTSGKCSRRKGRCVV